MSSSTGRTDLPGPRIGWLVRPRTAWAVALVSLLAAVAVTVLVGEATRAPSALDTLPRDAESTVATALQQELPEDAAPAVVLFTADSGTLPRDSVPALQDVVDEARESLALASGPPVTPSEDGTAAVAALSLPQAGATETAATVTELRSLLDEASPDGVTAQVTGPAAIEADLAAVFEGADANLLLTTAAVVAVLLLLTYRSPVLWLVPLTVVAVARPPPP